MKRLAVLIASRNRPELVDALVAQLSHSSIEHDVYVVECGSDPDKLSKHTTLWYPDPDFRGKCFGHHLLLEEARASGPYDYYWVLMNDLVFEPGVDAAQALIETLEREPRMGIVSPTCADGLYPASDRRPAGGWRAATTVDYLGFLMRGSALEEVGFLNPAFRYCWGAIHELAYKLYRAGWFVAYSDDVTYNHLGGSTYGAKGTNTISREEYQRRARRFAYDYFLERYGPDWERTFLAATEGHAIEVDTFAQHKALWAEGFTSEELAEREARAAELTAGASATGADPLLPPEPGADGADDLVRLHLGCGTDYREGWVNVDADPDVRTDACTSVTDLSVFADGSADVIEAAHLFEHLTLFEARAALAEWRRVLKPGGELYLELPDLEACIRLLGRHADDRGIDLAMTGLYGWPPDVEAHGAPMMHKWGWSRTTLAGALREAGFDDVAFGPITQTWRPAAKIGRDLRVRARTPLPVSAAALHAAPHSASNAARGQDASDPAPARSADAFPLATAAAVRVLAWPDYADAHELDQLFERFGGLLAEHPDACLCLRHDLAVDGPGERVGAALSAAFERTLGDDAPLTVLLVDDALDGDGWRRLGLAVDGVLLLPSSSTSPRAEALARTRARNIGSADRLRALLTTTVRAEAPADDAPETGPYPEDILDTVDWRLVEQIGELNPWTYPAVLGNLRVHPGKGTPHTSEELEERTRRLARLVLATAEVDFAERSVLELGCDCAFWSARAVEHGASGVVGVDLEERKLRQAELYFAHNEYLPPEARSFLQGDLEHTPVWERLARLAPFDVTLCIGLLEDVEDPGTLLRRAAEVTGQTLVVVTRFAHFDGLLETLVPLGFEAAVEDDLEAGLTAWVARRTQVRAPDPSRRSATRA